MCIRAFPIKMYFWGTFGFTIRFQILGVVLSDGSFLLIHTPGGKGRPFKKIHIYFSNVSGKGSKFWNDQGKIRKFHQEQNVETMNSKFIHKGYIRCLLSQHRVTKVHHRWCLWLETCCWPTPSISYTTRTVKLPWDFDGSDMMIRAWSDPVDFRIPTLWLFRITWLWTKTFLHLEFS